MKDIIVHTSNISKDVNFEWEKKNLEFFKSARDYEFACEEIKELHNEILNNNVLPENMSSCDSVIQAGNVLKGS